MHLVLHVLYHWCDHLSEWCGQEALWQSDDVSRDPSPKQEVRAFVREVIAVVLQQIVRSLGVARAVK